MTNLSGRAEWSRVRARSRRFGATRGARIARTGGVLRPVATGLAGDALGFGTGCSMTAAGASGALATFAGPAVAIGALSPGGAAAVVPPRRDDAA